MPLPEQDILQRGDELAAQRDPGFVTENLPSPDGFTVPDLKPFAIPGTGEFEYGDAQSKKTGQLSQNYINQVLGTEDRPTPGDLPTFTASEVFNPRYRSILPGEDSEEAFAKGQPWFKKWGNALYKFGASALGTFANGMMAIPDTIASITGGAPYDTNMGNDIDRFMRNLENEFPNYYTKWEQDHPFMSALPFSGGFSNFWGDKVIKNLGFTVGAIGSAVATEYILAASTAGVGAIPGLANTVGRTALLLNKVFTGTDRLANLGRLGMQAGRTTEQILQLERLAAAAAASKVANGTRYALSLYGAAASEAGYEAREGYNTVKDEMMKAYQRERGYSPIGKDLEDVENYARDAANTRFGANLALLSISNAVQFNSIMRPFNVARTGVRGSIQRELGQQIGLAEGSIDTFERTVTKGIPSKVWGKIKPAVPAILSEGVFEEGGQFAAQAATENYYVRKFMFDKGISSKQYEKDETPWDAKDQIDNVLHSIVKGMADEFGTLEGQENIFIGSIIGAMSAGVQKFVDRNKDQRQVQATLNILNSQGVTGTFQNNYESTVQAYRISEDMRQAAESGDAFKYKNYQHEAFTNFMVSGIKAGRFDVRMMQLDMLKEMGNEEFKKAFGLEKTTDNLQTVDEYVDLLKSKGREIKKNYDLINETFRNPFTQRTKIENTDQALENEKYHHFEGWKDELVRLASILPDVHQRLTEIGDQVSEAFANTNPRQIAMLTDRKAMKEYLKTLEDRANNLEAGLDGKLSVDRAADERELKVIRGKIDDIHSAMNDGEFKGPRFEKFFRDTLTYFLNGETPATAITVPAAAIPKLIDLSVEINRLQEYRDSANKAFDALSTEEGFNKYFAQVKAEQERQSTREQPTSTTPPPRGVIKVRATDGTEKTFEEGVDYFIKIDNDPNSNPVKVKIIGQTPDGVTVQTEDGTQILVPNETFFGQDQFANEVTQDINTEVPTSEETTQSPPEDSGTQVGSSMKDLSFGTFSTTDPTYNRKDIPFDNFHRRNQNFLFNLSSSDPDIFNQDNRAKLRIIPVTAATATKLGFPEVFTEGNQSVDQAPIRAVYVIDDRMTDAEKQKQRVEILKEIEADQGISDVIKAMFRSNPDEAIDNFYQQLQSGDATRAETELSLGDDVVTLIEDYKSAGLFYVDVNGNKLGQISNAINPDIAVFTNFASTELTYEAQRGVQADRYTNKLNLDPAKVQDWWRKQRADILAITEVDAIPIYQFDVSRGIPNIVNDDLRNPVTEVGLVRVEDFDRPILTIPTVGNVANAGAYNSVGEGIAAAKAGTNMPLGTPLLNFGGNMVFLNGRTFTPSEARNIVNLLKIASDRSTSESRRGIFSYLNKIIQMGNPDRGVKPTASSITVQGNSLFLGTSTSPIQFTPSAIEENREQIFEFLLKIYHGVKNAELLRIAKNPKASDLGFNELGVEGNKVVILNKWKNYNHYLLSATDPEGKDRGQPPLVTNIAVPVEGEVPIIQKYAVLKNMDFDAKVFEAKTPPKPPPAPTPVQQTPASTDPKAPTGKVAQFLMSIKNDDGTVTLYRGVGPGGEKGTGQFWTNDEKIAKWYADRFGEGGKVISARVPLGAALKGYMGQEGKPGPAQNSHIFSLPDNYNPELKKANIQQGVKPVEPAKEEAVKVEFVQIGQLKLGFSNVIRDAEGNITDLTPEGLVKEDGSVQPFPQPDVVKTTILDILRKSQPKKDETTPSNKPSWLGDKNLKKGEDDQYRQFTPGESYKVGDIDAEFKEAERMLGDRQLFVKVQHILKTTGGGLAYGAFIDNVIYVWQGAKVGTTYHEVFEKVWNTFLTGKEQQNLYDEFITREGTFTTFGQGDIKFSQASMQQAKEQMAEEFTEFILTKKLPQPKRQRSFFQRLWDFIKRIIFGTESDINHLFKRINKEYYRNFSSSLRGPIPAQYREVALEDFSEAFIQDTLQGMTIEMFMQAYREASDIVAQMEDNTGIPVKSLYDKLKSNLTHYFESTDPQYGNTFAAEMNSKYMSLTADDDKATFEAQVISILDSWQKIKDKWEAFVAEHKRYLKVFNVEFTVDDDGNIAFNEQDVDYDDQNRNQVEYERDIFKIDAKNSASTKIKLLIATLADSYWKEATRESIGATRSNQIGIKRDNSIVALPKQVQYAKLFNYLLHNTSGINGIYDMWAKLGSMTEDVETRKPIDANLQRLMNRVDFRGGFGGKNINQAKMILALENTLAKQKPAFFRQFVDANNQVYFKTSVLNSKIGQVKASWIADIKGSGAVLPAGDNQFKFSKSVIGIADPINFLSKIGIEIPRKDYNKLNARDKTRFNEAVNVVRELVERSANTQATIPVLSAKQMDFDSRLDDLADLYVSNMVGDDAQSQHPNLDNEPTSNFVLNNFVSTVLNDANNSTTREEFLSKLDNGYLRDIFHKDSILLNEVLFTPQGEFNQAVALGVVEGREKWDQNNKSTSKLTEAERQVYEINNNLNGVFYTLLPADAKTEWAVYTGTYLSPQAFFGDSATRGAEVTRFANQMYKWLQTEVELARDYENRKDVVALTREVNGRPVGKSLRFFKDILPKEIVDIIHKDAIDGNKPLGSFFTAAGLRPYMVSLIEQKAKQTLDNLVEWNVFQPTPYPDEFMPFGIDRQFLNNFLATKGAYKREELVRLFAFREANYIMNNIEMHKMFFGDPAQYKDELKRIKSFLSGREQTHVDTLNTPEGFNYLADQELNQASGVRLQPGDPGYHQFKNYAATITVRDVTFESDSIEELTKELGEERAAPYKEGNEADAQALIMPTFYREIMHKSGGRFTGAQERQFQWEMAWERDDKSKEGKYTYSSKELERADKKLLQSPPEEVDFPILKLMHSGIQTKKGIAIASLDKASWAPMFYRWVKGRANEKLYNSLQRKGRDYVRMESAHKVGIQNSSLTNLYDVNGNINVLQLDALEDEYIPLKQFGIQVEQSKKGKGQTEGSQARKIVTGDLMSNGVPVDVIDQYSNDEVAYEEWNKLTDEEKLERSPIYSKIRRHDDALIALVETRVNRAIEKLGMQDESGVLVIPDKSQVSAFILRELERRELPRNIAYGLEVQNGEFSQPLEANAQYAKIRQIIYSVIDDTIMRPTVNGGQKTMLSVTGWEKDKRIIKRTVNGKPVYTSSELKFYKQGDGKTEACEIMIPYWFGKMLKDKGSFRTKEEVLDYLNNTAEGQKLIRGIGFRIPTQGLNSIDFFVVKDFLPEGMGSAIVLPSEITVKAGSDFDIDKLNVYLRNYYIDNKTGYPKAVQYKGSQEETMKYLEELLDSGNVITREEAQELDRIISEETDDIDFDNLMMRIPGVADMFSDTEITRDFLKGRREYILSKMYLQSLENEYFDSIESLVSDPVNFKRLVQPNSADEMKGYRTRLLELKGQSEKKNPLGDFGRLLDSQYMMKERQAYMSSKGVVGTSAVSQVSHAVSQNMPGGLLVLTPSINARFPHNTIAGKITLSGLYTAGTKNLISNINSQTTDGGVDVSKDKFLAEMGITSDTLKDFLALTRMGSSPWWATLYLNQPAIQAFLKKKAIHASVSQVNPWIRPMSDIKLINQVRAQFGIVFKSNKVPNKPTTYSIKQMEEMIQKYAEGKALTKDENLLQVMMLDDYTRYNKNDAKYEGYSALGWYLFDFYQGYSWDTARVNDPNAIRLKEYRYEKANLNPISPVSNIMETSFIGAMMRGVLRLDQGLRETISVQQGAGNTILNRLAGELFYTPGLPEQTRRDLMLAAELNMVNYMIQTNAEVLGRSINSYMYPAILGQKAVAVYIKAIQRSNDKRLTNNPFIKNLVANIDTRSGWPSMVTLAERDYDTYTSNIWTDGFEEMKDDATVISINNNEEDDRTVGQIYRNLVLAAIIQSGAKRTSNSLSHLIPNETYSQFVSQAIRMLNLDGFWDNYVFYRANWANNTLVSKVEMEPYDPEDPLSEMIYPFISNPDMNNTLMELTNSKNPPTILNVMAWKYGRKKAIKILSPLRDDRNQLIGFVPQLFLRVDIPGIASNEPLSIMEGRVLFKQINAWGDGRNISEFYRDARPSQLPLNAKVTEATDEQIVYAAYKAGFTMNIATDAIDHIITKFGGGSADTDENGNSSPDPEPVTPTTPLSPIAPSEASPIEFAELESEGWKKSGKKETFSIEHITKGREPVEGYRITFKDHPDLLVFVHGQRGSWILSDETTGKAFNSSPQKTIAAAVEDAIEKTNKAIASGQNKQLLRDIGISEKQAKKEVDDVLKDKDSCK